MAEIDAVNDLTQINQQLEQLIIEYNKKDAEMKQLMQQIQNLTGITMYLRGKIGDVPQSETGNTNNTSNDKIPDALEIVNDT